MVSLALIVGLPFWPILELMEGLREFLRSDLLLLAGEYSNFDFLVILALVGGVSLLLAQPIRVNIKLI